MVLYSLRLIMSLANKFSMIKSCCVVIVSMKISINYLVITLLKNKILYNHSYQCLCLCYSVHHDVLGFDALLHTSFWLQYAHVFVSVTTLQQSMSISSFSMHILYGYLFNHLPSNCLKMYGRS